MVLIDIIIFSTAMVSNVLWKSEKENSTQGSQALRKSIGPGSPNCSGYMELVSQVGNIDCVVIHNGLHSSV
jgi:hypothetical protein